MKWEAWFALALLYGVPGFAVVSLHYLDDAMPDWAGRLGLAMLAVASVCASIGIVVWGMS